MLFARPPPRLYTSPRICGKLLDRAHHVMAVNIVAHSLAIVSKNGILAAAALLSFLSRWIPIGVILALFLLATDSR
jgi:hypothetical protein